MFFLLTILLGVGVLGLILAMVAFNSRITAWGDRLHREHRHRGIRQPVPWKVRFFTGPYWMWIRVVVFFLVFIGAMRIVMRILGIPING
jgi:hypothetical protein